MARQIDNFIEENLSFTYDIVYGSNNRSLEDTTPEDITPEDLSLVFQVDYEEWRSRRNNDFLQFFFMLKEMSTETGK